MRDRDAIADPTRDADCMLTCAIDASRRSRSRIVVVTVRGAPYVRAASLFVRAAHLGGRTETFANAMARPVTALPRHTVPTRQGDVAAQWYRPDGRIRRAALLVPGIHSMGIAEPRLTALAQDLAGSGVAVMTMALPDLMGYRITARSADVIEDAVAWMAAQPDLAPDGRVGMVGISFAGGLSIVAAGRPSIRDKVAFVVSFGGHGDLARVLKYLATGEARAGSRRRHASAARLRRRRDPVRRRRSASCRRIRWRRCATGIGTFLLASQLTLVNMDQANATFQKARDMVKGLPEPSATLLDLRERSRRQGARPDPGSASRPRGRSGRVARAGADAARRAGVPAARRRGHRHPDRRVRRAGRLSARARASRCTCCSARSSRTPSSIDPRQCPKRWKLVSFWADVLRH